jgi:ABC-type lipoprotein export system ATPase subunit
MIDPIVRLRDVFCVHRTNEGDAAALQGMNLDLEHGELLCVLGPSGAGKSTLLRVIAGLQPPSAGIVQVLEQDIGRTGARSRARLRHREMGFVGQSSDDALAPDLRVRQALELPLALRGVAAGRRRARAQELLEAAGLSDRASALPGELSGGERQRVAVCAAVAHRPALLLADEPTGELDAASAATVRALIAGLAREEGTSVLVVSHDQDTASVADRTVRIRDGRVVEDHRDGQSALVIGRGGWLRLPSDLLAGAGIGD